MRISLLLLAAAGLALSPTCPAAQSGGASIADTTEIWSTWSGAGRMELRADYLPGYGLEILVDGRAADDRTSNTLAIRDLGSLSFHAVGGQFQDFIDGRLDLVTNVVLAHGDRRVSLEQLVATPGHDPRNGHPALLLTDPQGRHLLTLTHLHIIADAKTEVLTIHNAEVLAMPALARAL
ncbi:MAG: hypothetical protein R3323_09690, partial [Wenzhouxiangellaceae bacterium]|nr:hypothetical protein [Wenzhouxiangellaceae bacterium]